MTLSNKLGLLLWKNLKVLQRHWIVTIFEFMIPFLLFALVAWIKTHVRGDTEPVVHKPETFQPYDFNNISEVFQNSGTMIYYTPKNNFTFELMEDVRSRLSLNPNRLAALSSESDLEKIQNSLNGNSTHQSVDLIGVIFGEKDQVPKKFDYKIRSSNSRWRTSLLFPTYQHSGPMDNSELYFHTGFLFIQSMIDRSYMKMVGLKENLVNQKNYAFVIQEFPYPSFTEDSSSSALTSILTEFVVYGFVISLCMNLLKHIVADKKTGVTELMKLMGLTRLMLWLSWLIRVLMVNVPVVTAIVLLLMIPFNEDYGGVISHSNGFLIWVFLMLYCLASTTSMFFVSTLFYRPVLALCFGAIIWTGSYYIPNAVLAYFKSSIMLVKLLTALFPNMAVFWGFQAIAGFESVQIGANWGNLFRSPSGSPSDLRMGHVLLMLIFDTLLYSSLTWYMDSIFPGHFGVPQPWNFFCTKSFWQNQKVGVTRTGYGTAGEIQKNFEPPLQGLTPGIRIQDLRKTYPSGKVAVDGVTLDIYQGQITALLGHNGAGKTTTMSVLTGMLPPTSGSVYINEYDIRYDLPKVRESLGLCPQHDMLFDELTVIDHFIFFGMLKGLSRTDATREAKILLEQIQLSEKANSMSSQLSGGMKRKVSLGVALIGGSQVVILDEPTSGLDPEARRQIWDLLLSMRGSRTIVITTHFMEEADVLGDRIAIMDHGHVECYGTSLYLKKLYGAGYLLKLMIREPCDIAKITQVVQRAVSDAKMKNRLGTELSYSLPSEQKSLFPKLFDALDLRKEDLNIVSIGVSITTMEEVFLKVGKTATDAGNSGALSDDDQCIPERLSRSNSLVSLEGKTPQKSPLLFQQLAALLTKKLLYMYRKLTMLGIQALIPILMIASAVALGSKILRVVSRPEPALPLSLAEYGSTDVLFSESQGTPVHVARSYETLVRSAGSSPIRISHLAANVSDALLKEGDRDIGYFREKLVVAAEFGPEEGNAMYSGIAYHGVAISVNLMHNAILKSMTNSSEYSITVVNHPLKFESPNINKPIPEVALIWQQFIPLGMLYLIGYFLIFPLLERVSNAKQLQIMTGLSPIRYWLPCFICDFFVYMLVALLMVLMVPLFDTYGHFGGSSEMATLILLLTLYGISGIPYGYWFSYFSKTSAGGFGLFVGVNFLIGGVLPLIVAIMEGLLGSNEFWSGFTKVLRKCLYLLPPFCFSTGIFKFTAQVLNNNWCESLSFDVKNRICLAKPFDPCCEDSFPKQSYLEFESETNPQGMGLLLLFLFLDAILYVVIVLLLDYGIIAYAREAVKKLTLKNPPPSGDEVDGDVKMEYVRVKEDEGDALVVNDLAKVYGWRSLAVKGVTFGVMHGECFGLLGVNGAGKTTTFKMLTGNEIPTRGDASVDQYKLSKNKTEYLSQIGYCPQFDAFNETLTGREMLQVFARLRAVPSKEVNSEVEKWLKLLGLTEYQDCRCGTYSGGNKRKLSTAMALIGDPPLIFLDEPTSGVDPVARRNLWSVLAKIQKTKHSIVLTSHSMEECEALCNRLAIMVKGQFVCIGENQYLKQKFGQGFTVMIKLNDTAADGDQVDNVKEEIHNMFSSSVLKDEYKGLLHYHLTDPHIPWKVLFENMEALTARHNVIEDYTISETTLEQLFLAFAQTGEDHTKETKV